MYPYVFKFSLNLLFTLYPLWPYHFVMQQYNWCVDFAICYYVVNVAKYCLAYSWTFMSSLKVRNQEQTSMTTTLQLHWRNKSQREESLFGNTRIKWRLYDWKKCVQCVPVYLQCTYRLYSWLQVASLWAKSNISEKCFIVSLVLGFLLT